MGTALQFNLDEISAQHRAAMAASLAHRMAVAKAAQNTQLIALLEQEQKQLDLAPRQPVLSELVGKVKQLWHSWREAIDRHSRLSVEQVVGEDGTIFWYAHDPKTGKTLYTESRSDVVKWIEDNELGR